MLRADVKSSDNCFCSDVKSKFVIVESITLIDVLEGGQHRARIFKKL